MSDSVRAGMPQRLLRLLSLLHSRREWSGAELTERLGVSARTLRRDVERLRELDYRVEGTPGTAGGYRLGFGHGLPPLLLDDDEAVAIALGLVTVPGLGDSALRALAKLERLLPARLRPRLAAVADSATAVPHHRASGVDPAVLGLLASHCRGRVVTDLAYRDRAGNASERRVEPHHLVFHGGHWYLIAHDQGRDDWRSLRVDRVRDPRATHRRFPPRRLPEPDPAAFLTRLFAGGTYRYTVLATLETGAEELRARFYGPLPGRIEPRGAHGCRVRISADSLDLVCQYTAAVLSLGVSGDLEAPPEVAVRLREAGALLGRAGQRFADGPEER
ncbi:MULTISPECIES: YafY family protein [unclassified Nocardiopsis]|uniref:helix-turn-helix transcriptional regulator n=1 Tax=unclassified Nocardiopsis TaxID=2649073 RepID=UPI001F457F6A|nr:MULTISPECIES: YafY family protein [unclassified Nocardiopsis]